MPFIELTAYDDYTRSTIIKGLSGKTEIQPGDYQYKGFMSNGTQSVKADSSTVQAIYVANVTAEGIVSLQAMKTPAVPGYTSDFFLCSGIQIQITAFV